MHKPNRLAQLIIGIRLMFLILNPANALRDVPRMGLWISFLLVSRLKGCSVGELGVARHVARSMGHRRTHTHTHNTLAAKVRAFSRQNKGVWKGMGNRQKNVHSVYTVKLTCG